MKLFLAKTKDSLPLIDVLKHSKQIYQQNPPEIKRFLARENVSDCYLIPHDASHWTADYYKYVISLSKSKPVIFFNRFDIARKVLIENGYSLQNAHCGKFNMNTIVIPYNIISLESCRSREYFPRPKISFVGYIPSFGIRRIWHSSKCDFLHPIKNNPAYVRRSGIKHLEAQFPDAFIVKRSHYGGAKKLIDDVQQFRDIYVRSIEDSDLVFCPRGDANFSQRFYEVISAGRVPIIPNTRSYLPKCGEKLNIFWINCRNGSKDLETNVYDFWDSLSQDQYTEIQFANRIAFRKHLNYQDYLTRLLESELAELHRVFTYFPTG